MAGLKRGGWMGALACTLAGLVVLAAPVALAIPRYRNQAVVQFHYDRGNPLWQLDRRVMACTYCHVKESGSAPWNPFGEAIRAAFRADAEAGKHSKFPQILSAVLQAGGDADQDGYLDVLEVFARTLPGDPKSRPAQPVADLQAAFEKAGGLGQYLPGK